MDSWSLWPEERRDRHQEQARLDGADLSEQGRPQPGVEEAEPTETVRHVVHTRERRIISHRILLL